MGFDLSDLRERDKQVDHLGGECEVGGVEDQWSEVSLAGREVSLQLCSGSSDGVGALERLPALLDRPPRNVRSPSVRCHRPILVATVPLPVRVRPRTPIRAHKYSTGWGQPVHALAETLSADAECTADHPASSRPRKTTRPHVASFARSTVRMQGMVAGLTLCRLPRPGDYSGRPQPPRGRRFTRPKSAVSVIRAAVEVGRA